MSEAEKIREAADELRTAIALHVGRLADQILGRPELGTPEWVAELDARDTPEGQARLREWHLTKLQICREAGVDQTGDVINARKCGASWAAVGEACGITRQAAHDRWGRFTGRRLCAHADDNGRGMHWLEPGERCPLEPKRETSETA